MSTQVARRESAAPRRLQPESEFDVEVDVIVVGGGASGLPCALFTRWLDNEVLLLEKAPDLGGTANKAAFWYWIPNNARMRELGLVDDEASFLRYCACLPAGMTGVTSMIGVLRPWSASLRWSRARASRFRGGAWHGAAAGPR